MASSILVIGAGAAGLIAARQLAAAGFAVTLLEAAAVPGGRIHSFSIPGFAGFVEAGAEFVHGDLPITLQIAREAGGELITANQSQTTLRQENFEVPFHGNELLEAMERLQEDQPIA